VGALDAFLLGMKRDKSGDEEGPVPRRWELREVSSERLREREDSILYAAGYRPTEDGMWRRSEMLFDRGAALQYALIELREKGEPNLFDQP
jgi:hypothetical protein